MAVKERYSIPVSLDRTILDHELSLSNNSVKLKPYVAAHGHTTEGRKFRLFGVHLDLVDCCHGVFRCVLED